MRKRVRSTLAVLLVAIAGVIAWQVQRLREPVYQGKRLSVWLQRYSSGGDSPEVDEAVRKMGTNAIPTLLGNLQTKDSALKLTLAALGLHYTPAGIRHMRAEKGFKALQAHASNAVPALIEIYEQNSAPSARRAAANALVDIGLAAKQAIPALIKGATSRNSDARALAVYTLGRMALEPELVDPVLIKSLHDPDREVRYNAAFGLSALAFMGGDAKPAVPALVETLEDRYGTARAAAAMALGHIHCEPGLVVPALVESLRDREVFVRAQAAAALGEFGTNAKPAVAQLVDLIGETNQQAREAVSKALRQIDPETAAKAGVK